MSGGTEQATFAIKLDSNVSATAKPDADSLEGLRDRLLASQSAVQQLSSTMKRLRGTSDEVKAARNQLKVQLDAERDAISSGTLALAKQGTTLEQVGSKVRALADSQAKAALEAEKLRIKNEKIASEAAQAARGPIAELRDGWEKLMGKFGSADGVLAIAAGGLAVLAAAAIAATAAIIGGVVAFTKFALAGANAQRSAGLFREAVTGSASDAARLGQQVDALSKKVPTAKDELNKLAVSLRQSGLSGQTLVDTLNASAQASSALGDSAGSKLQDIISRGKLTGRVGINPQELLGTGISFSGIAESLAKNMKVGVNEARAALVQGRVSIGDGAKAIRDAVEKQVGGVNLKKMLDLNVIAQKFEERFQSLTRDIKLEPLLTALGKFTDLLDESTVTGATLKRLMTGAGNSIVEALTKGIPLAKAFFQGAIIGALRAYIVYLKLKNAVMNVFGGDALGSIANAKLALEVAAGAVTALVAVLAVAAASVALVAAPFALVFAALYGAVAALSDFKNYLAKVDWGALGASIMDGLISGLRSGITKVESTVQGIASSIKDTFKDALGIHSPSKVFAEFGENTTEGYAQGVDGSAGNARDAVAAMIAPPSGGGSSGGRAGAPITINITIEGGNAKEMSDASFLAKITKAVEDALTGAGVAVQA